MPALPQALKWLVGGAVAAVLLPLLALGASMPLWIAAVVSAFAGGGVVAMLAPERRFARLEARGIARNKIEFARELMIDAEPQIRRIENAADTIPATQMAERMRHLVTVARGIFTAVEKDPLRIDRVRRFLTYYLPRAADIAEAYGALEKSTVPDHARIAATGELIGRLDTAFTHYAANLQDADLDKLDIELKLLKNSLDEDLGPAT